MKLNITIIAIVSLMVLSCDISKEEKKPTNNSIALTDVASEQEEGYNLLKNNCYACHSITAVSHDAIIAPPLMAVKRRYKASYNSKEAFVEGMTNWVLDPKTENALMRGAVMQFNVMPKQVLKKEDILKITAYIYDNELEKPAWFEDHFNEEHPNGMGNGRGRGRGRGNGKGMRGNANLLPVNE